MKWKNTFLVGIYKCELTFSKNQGLHAKWSPKLPRELSPQEIAQYRSGRDNLLAEVGSALGGQVLVVEA
jgi:hypothetical protein